MTELASIQQQTQTQTLPKKHAAPVKDHLGRSYGTGKRKDAVARVWVKSGKGNITVNNKQFDKYFFRPSSKAIVLQPLMQTKAYGMVDIVCTVKGSGLSGQAGAIRHGISNALTLFDPTLRSVLRTQGFLTCDDRVVERKKYGHKKARRSFQFCKR